MVFGSLLRPVWTRLCLHSPLRYRRVIMSLCTGVPRTMRVAQLDTSHLPDQASRIHLIQKVQVGAPVITPHLVNWTSCPVGEGAGALHRTAWVDSRKCVIGGLGRRCGNPPATETVTSCGLACYKST